MNQMMYCVTVLSVIAMLVIEFGGAFLIGLIVFYLAAGFFCCLFHHRIYKCLLHHEMAVILGGSRQDDK